MPMDPTTAAALFNPQVAADQQALARNMAIAQFLRQQSMTQQDAQGTGGIASPTSPLAAIARVLMGIQANKLDTQNDSDRLRMAQMVSQAMQNAMPELGGQPSGPGLSLGGVSAPPAGPQFSVSPQASIRALVGAPGGEDMVKAEIAAQAPTDKIKESRDPTLGAATRAAAWAPTFLNGGKIQLGQNGTPTVNPVFGQSESAAAQATGDRETKDIKLGNGQTVQLTPNEIETLATRGTLPLRYASPAQLEAIRRDANRTGTPADVRLSSDFGTVAGKVTPETVANPNVGVTQSPANAKFLEGRAGTAVEYEKALNSRVDTGRDLMERSREMLGLMDQIRTGGGQEVRTRAAQLAQAFGMPDSIVQGLVGGDLAATQAFQTLAATKTLEDMKQALGPNMKGNRNEFLVFERANPGLDKDPNAIRKVFAFQQRMYAKDLDEQSRFNEYIAQGKDPANFPAIYARSFMEKSNPPQAAPKPAPQANDIRAAAMAELAKRQKQQPVQPGWYLPKGQ